MLTHTQRKLLLFIERRLDETGRVPTYREMTACGYGDTGTVHSTVVRIAGRGHIEKQRRWGTYKVIRPISRFAVFRFDDEKKELVNA